MRCATTGCTGEYEARTIARTYRRRGELVVVDGIPVEVCSICGDTILRLETVDEIQATFDRYEGSARPPASVPVFRFGAGA